VTGSATGSAAEGAPGEDAGDGEASGDTSSSSSIAADQRGFGEEGGGEGSDSIWFGGRVGFGGAAVPAAWGCRALRGIRLGLGTAGGSAGRVGLGQAGRMGRRRSSGGRRRGWFGLVGNRRVGRQEDRFPTFRPWYIPPPRGRHHTIGRIWQTLALFARQKSILAIDIIYIYLIEQSE